MLGDRRADRIKKLEDHIAHPFSRQDEIDALNELAWELRMSWPEQVYTLCNRADQLSRSGEYTSRPYEPGLAASLVNQAFVDTHKGRLDVAVSKCLQALAWLEETPSRLEVRIWLTLGWNSFFLSDYPAAMEHGIQALEKARGLGDRLHEAWALDAVASFHGVTGDFESAIPLHEEALQVFRSLNEVLGEMRTLNNLAVSRDAIQEHVRAFEEARRSLELAKQQQLEMDICISSCTLADILINMGRLDEAETCLKESMSGYLSDLNLTHVSVLARVGKLHFLKNDLQGAEAYVVQALELARSLDQRAEQVDCHKSLSEIHERQGNYVKALEHYRKFHELQNAVLGEQVAKRLAVLKITHQVESARHEAEIYRLKARELEKKVDEQKLTHHILELQIMLDPLTDLYNRRYFDKVFVQECSRHSRSETELSLLMLDVDHFKAFNDAHGHVRGDECLQQISKVIRQSLTRPSDVAVRYGGEEFICLLPETDLKGALTVAEYIRQAVMELAIPHGFSDVSRVVTLSIGGVTTRCTRDTLATDLVAIADEQLYLAKSRGRNCVEVVQRMG